MEAAVPEKHLPVKGPTFDKEGRLEELAVRGIALKHEELQVMPRDQLVLDRGVAEVGGVGRHRRDLQSEREVYQAPACVYKAESICS